MYCLPWLLPLAAMPSAIYVYGGFLAHCHRPLSTSNNFLVNVHAWCCYTSIYNLWWIFCWTLFFLCFYFKQCPSYFCILSWLEVIWVSSNDTCPMFAVFSELSSTNFPFFYLLLLILLGFSYFFQCFWCVCEFGVLW